MRLARTAISEQEEIFLPRQKLTSGQFQHQRLVERGDGKEVETVQALDHRKSCLADAAFRGSAIAVQLFLAFLRRADEGTVGRLLVQITILLAASRRDSAHTLSNATEVNKVDVEAIRQKVRLEFTAKQKAKQQKKPATAPTKARKTA
jgi:ParB family chromosome partitioning protein